jgi:hypothetical protein
LEDIGSAWNKSFRLAVFAREGRGGGEVVIAADGGETAGAVMGAWEGELEGNESFRKRGLCKVDFEGGAGGVLDGLNALKLLA